MDTTSRSRVFTANSLTRIIIGWVAVAVLAATADFLGPPLPGTMLLALLMAVVAIIMVCSFGVVTQAEKLANRMGDPYGSLVLTISIVLIEVILISAVMLGPGDHTTIGRDSVMAVSMIIMNLVVGAAVLMATRKYGALSHNRTGTATYSAMLVILLALAFVIPGQLDHGGSYPPGVAVTVAVGTLAAYGYFLYRQMFQQPQDFAEVDPIGRAAAWHLHESAVETPQHDVEPPTQRQPIGKIFAKHRTEILLRIAVLIITVIPVVILAQYMAAFLDDGLSRTTLPIELAGVLIAAIVFLPETITAIRAGIAGELQRVINLCHGALVSTVSFTIPAVLLIGLATGQTVILAETGANVVLLAVTMLLTINNFLAPRLTVMHAVPHLMVFGVYVLLLFS
ncbi:calcium:proton antiporter [Enteractinococcus coprophilus]|nr:calcium:proton antiporter [Enteractinococcus coprophilus]